MGYIHREKWNEDNIMIGIQKVCKVLMIKKMPTRSEIKSVINNDSLTNAICRNGGYKYFASKFNLEMKNSETLTGWMFEDVAKASMETCFNYKVEKMSTKYPYDFLINDFIKVDVKCARPFYIKSDRVHTFNINKIYATCDIYIVYALDDEDKIERTFIIPAHELKVVTMCIGKESKYNKYIERWDYLEKYNKFHEKLSS